MCDRVLCYMFFLYNMNEAIKHSSLFFLVKYILCTTCFYTYSNSSLFCKSFKTFDDTYNVCRIYYPIDASMHLQAAPACARGVAQPPSRYRRRDRGRGRRMDALSARHGRLPVPEHVRTYLQLQGPAAAGDRIGWLIDRRIGIGMMMHHVRAGGGGRGDSGNSVKQQTAVPIWHPHTRTLIPARRAPLPLTLSLSANVQMIVVPAPDP